LNAPCAAGSGRKEIFAAFEGLLVPAMRKFKPDFVLISAGFDSRVGDPLGQLTLSDHDFGDLTHLMLEIAGGRLVSVLEGGYSLSGLGAASGAHVEALRANA
jgi:acetoin utilization deacetylase AcuC-like enzyme